MNIETIVVGAFATNCYLLSDPDTSEAIFIDPGAETEILIQKVKELNLHLKFIINTHCHIDHAGEVIKVQDAFDVPFYIHEEDRPLLYTLVEQGEMFGLHIPGIPKNISFVNDGDELEFGNFKLKVIHTPGHSPGGLSILFNDNENVFVGDSLFMDSIGRTDLYKGDYKQLIHSIKTRLLVLYPDYTVYPGHGPSTTIGREKLNNPFF